MVPLRLQAHREGGTGTDEGRAAAEPDRPEAHGRGRSRQAHSEGLEDPARSGEHGGRQLQRGERELSQQPAAHDAAGLLPSEAQRQRQQPDPGDDRSRAEAVGHAGRHRYADEPARRADAVHEQGQEDLPHDHPARSGARGARVPGAARHQRRDPVRTALRDRARPRDPVGAVHRLRAQPRRNPR